MEKYDAGVLGGIENLIILMREECDVYHYSTKPEVTRVYYKTCPLEIGASIKPATGYIEIVGINQTKDDVQVVLEYGDYLKDPHKAYVSLDQKIKFYMMDYEDDAPENYFVDNCYLLIDSKKYAKQVITEYNKDKNKQYIIHYNKKDRK